MHDSNDARTIALASVNHGCTMGLNSILPALAPTAQHQCKQGAPLPACCMMRVHAAPCLSAAVDLLARLASLARLSTWGRACLPACLRDASDGGAGRASVPSHARHVRFLYHSEVASGIMSRRTAAAAALALVVVLVGPPGAAALHGASRSMHSATTPKWTRTTVATWSGAFLDLPSALAACACRARPWRAQGPCEPVRCLLTIFTPSARAFARPRSPARPAAFGPQYRSTCPARTARATRTCSRRATSSGCRPTRPLCRSRTRRGRSPSLSQPSAPMARHGPAAATRACSA